MFTRLEAEAVGILILVAIACLWIGFHDAGVKREALAPVLQAEQAASAAASIKAAQVTAEQNGNLREANSQNLARAMDARAAAADLERMRNDAVRTVAAARAAASAAGGAAGGNAPAGMVSAELYAWAVGARVDAEFDAATLAGLVDGLFTSGGLCARDYDSAR